MLKLVFIMVTLSAIFLAFTITATPSQAQQRDRQEASPDDGRIKKVEDEIEDLKKQQRQADEVAKSLTESNRFYFTVLSVIVGVIVAVQSFFQGWSFFHQRGRNLERDRHVRHEYRDEG